MGRFESLTALSLGRTPYEPGIYPPFTSSFISYPPDASQRQQYTSNGRPTNPFTRQRERAYIRAANEVLQATGVVEDSAAAKKNEKNDKKEKGRETYLGLRLIEVGRVVFLGGVWGVVGLRRRIMLYEPYAKFTLVGLIRHELATRALTSMILAGLPSGFMSNLVDWITVSTRHLLDAVWNGYAGGQDALTPSQEWWKNTVQIWSDIGLCWVSILLRKFAILQQLGLISSSRLLPSAIWFIPFSSCSPIQLPPLPPTNLKSIVLFASACVENMLPLVIIFLQGKLEYAITTFSREPVYTSIPRPVRGSKHAKVAVNKPTIEFNALNADINSSSESNHSSQGQPTLEDPEGLLMLERTQEQSQPIDFRSEEGSDDSHDWRDHPTERIQNLEYGLSGGGDPSSFSISYATRTPDQPKPSPDGVAYRVTGLTVMPAILACDGIQSVAASILCLPLEAALVGFLARAYRRKAGLGVGDFYSVWLVSKSPLSFDIVGKVAATLTIQSVVMGSLWVGYVLVIDRVRKWKWIGVHRAS